MYRVGFPFWKLAARFNVPLLLRVEVMQDRDAGVFIATSPDLKGLVVEAKDSSELMTEAYNCVDMLLTEQLKRPLKNRPVAAWNGDYLAV